VAGCRLAAHPPPSCRSPATLARQTSLTTRFRRSCDAERLNDPDNEKYNGYIYTNRCQIWVVNNSKIVDEIHLQNRHLQNKYF
jgi:hypothetical protein